MIPAYYLIPILAAVTFASDLSAAVCQCPLVKCPANDPVALCNCLNGREARCQHRCPNYKPTYRPCPFPAPTPTLSPEPLPSLQPTSKPVTCDCPLVNCLQGAGLCDCVNTAAQNCYTRCGGEPPVLQSCEVSPPVEQPTCECETVFCIQSYPEGCYCANAAKQACYSKCGGVLPDLESCPPIVLPTLTTIQTPTPTLTSTSTSLPSPTSSLPPNPYKTCGGGRSGSTQCDTGYTCIDDPYTPGCGLACDGLGICVEDKMCAGFAGFACEDKSMVCHDDPRDECDPLQGGWDCAGLCVVPHRSMSEDLEGGV